METVVLEILETIFFQLNLKDRFSLLLVSKYYYNIFYEEKYWTHFDGFNFWKYFPNGEKNCLFGLTPPGLVHILLNPDQKEKAELNTSSLIIFYRSFGLTAVQVLNIIYESICEQQNRERHHLLMAIKLIKTLVLESQEDFYKHAIYEKIINTLGDLGKGSMAHIFYRPPNIGQHVLMLQSPLIIPKEYIHQVGSQLCLIEREILLGISEPDWLLVESLTIAKWKEYRMGLSKWVTNQLNLSKIMDLYNLAIFLFSGNNFNSCKIVLDVLDSSNINIKTGFFDIKLKGYLKELKKIQYILSPEDNWMKYREKLISTSGGIFPILEVIEMDFAQVNTESDMLANSTVYWNAKKIIAKYKIIMNFQLYQQSLSCLAFEKIENLYNDLKESIFQRT